MKSSIAFNGLTIKKIYIHIYTKNLKIIYKNDKFLKNADNASKWFSIKEIKFVKY